MSSSYDPQQGAPQEGAPQASAPQYQQSPQQSAPPQSAPQQGAAYPSDGQWQQNPQNPQFQQNPQWQQGAMPMGQAGTGTGVGMSASIGRSIASLALALASVFGLIIPLFFNYIWPYPGLILSALGLSVGRQAFRHAQGGPSGGKMLAIAGMIASGLMLLISVIVLIYVMATK